MQPGLYEGIPADQYHADHEAISASGMKLLLAPSTPAHYRWAMDHGTKRTEDLDFGTVAHRVVLEGSEDGVHIVEYDSWRTADSQAQAEAARAEGKIPILEHKMEIVRAMAAQLREHPLAAALLSNGKPEVSAWFPDPVTGRTVRSRFDWMPDAGVRAQFILSDYKTAKSAAPRAFGRAVSDYKYHLSQEVYKAAVRALLGINDPKFLFIVQEKEPPYAVNVIELEPDAVKMGRELMRRAIDLFDHCTTTGNWPAYEGVQQAALPVYATYEHQEILDAA